jgi:general secretion pathway protein D
MRFHPCLRLHRHWATFLLAAGLVGLAGPVWAQPVPTHPANPSGPPLPGSETGRTAGGPLRQGEALSPGGPGPLPVRNKMETSAPLVADDPGGTVGPLKFGDLTVDAALDLLEQWTGRIVLRPQALPATSLVLSISHPIPKAEAVQALDTILNLNGIAVAPMGEKFLKVTPLAQVRSEAPELIEGSTLNLPTSGRVAVKLFEFRYLTASELMPQLASLLSPGIGAAPVVVDKANSALITDTISNLQRIEKLIAQLDRPSLTKLSPKFYSLTNAKASDVANSVRSLLSGSLAAQIGNSVTIQADDRTNQLIILCDARQQPFFDELIEKLNSKGETNTRQEVIQLKHAVSKDVATLLTNLVTGRKQATGTGTGQQGQSLSAAQQAAAAARRTAPGATPNAPGAANPAPNTAAALLQTVSGGEAVTEFSSLLTIISEDRSNSLVVSGTVDDISIIRDLVGKLDILLAQVRIEMLICEVSLDDNQTSGISALGLQVVSGKLIGFNGSAAGISVGGGVDSTGKSSGFATFGPNHELSAILGLTTTPRKNHLTVLSAPTIVATHNQEATIFVGESDPVLSSYTNTGGSVGTITGGVGTGYNTAVTYKDIGIQVKVKPLIGNDGALELQISTDVNDIKGYVSVDGNQQPIVTKRSAESFVGVRNGEIIVLGGLQKKSSTLSTSRLGPIPIIGDLFGSRTKDRTRDDLVFFLRPYILTNTPADNESVLKRIDQGQQGPDVHAFLDSGGPKSP